MEIVLSAESGYKVKLESFDLAGYFGDKEVDGLFVDVDGTPVYQKALFTVLGSTSPLKTEFDQADFGETLEGSEISIRFIGTADPDGIGIDNITFSQSKE